ncbi:MepB family protein [Streptomyces sp. NPDC048506]|uniref:MepB family protein n=1 Tax=Streptomyces sp. NPDC048506 TaxID=3155028 RepID=UPI003428D514
MPVHRDLLAAKALAYDPGGFTCSQPVPEAESAEYAAYVLSLDGRDLRFRAAETAPTKVGQFVMAWQRSPEGLMRPFDTEDRVELFVISTRDDQHFGQFVFPGASSENAASRQPTLRRKTGVPRLSAVGEGSVDRVRAKAPYRP